MLFRDGDLITSTIAPPTSGILLHRGIVIIQDGVTCISHNTPCRKNEYGGNVIVEPLSTFLKDGREIISIEPSNVSISKVILFNEQLKERTFDSFEWNCEHYVSYILTGEKKSYQLYYWIGFAVLVGVTSLVLFGSKLRKR